MSGQQPNAWRTEQAQAIPLRQDGGRRQQANNFWAQRSSSASGSNGQRAEESAAQGDGQYTPANRFNVAEVKAALSRDAAPPSYKIHETASRGSGAAWGAKPSHMANNQPFFLQLAKQVATLEGARGG